MATKETMYATGADGYQAMVTDFTEMFDWDEIEPNKETAIFTNFKKHCSNNAYIGMRISQISNKRPTITAFSNNGFFTFSPSISSAENSYAAYAYGDGFFVVQASPSPIPNASNRFFGGISTCRNILTGETSWCSFMCAATQISGISAHDYYVLTKDTKELVAINWNLSTNAKIGSATLLHELKTGFVSDKVMALTAIPDIYYSSIVPVVFNGTRYTRLGMLLVPA